MDRNQIIENTTSLLKKYGLKSMTLDEISMLLRISKKSFYDHFTTKEELLLECLTLMNEDIEKLLAVVESNNENVLTRIISVYSITVEYLSQFNSIYYFDLKKKPNLKLMTLAHIAAYKLNRIRPLIQEAKNENLLAPKVDVEEAVDFFMKFIPHFFTNFKDDPAAIENHLALFLKKYMSDSKS